MGKRSEMGVDEMCEYRRCGGKGGREVLRPRRACRYVEVGGRSLHVCESCADLLNRDSAARVASWSTQEGGPQRIGEILRRMPLREKIPQVTPTKRRSRHNARGSGRGTVAGSDARLGREERVEPNADAERRSASLEQHIAPLVTRAAESASSEQRLYALLETRGCEFVDSRPKGGVLWIVGGKELEPTIREARRLGYAFTWRADGGAKTKGRAAWWCDEMGT